MFIIYRKMSNVINESVPSAVANEIVEEVIVTEKKSTYKGAQKKYYEKNKEEILRKYKETKPYNAFYQRNRDRLKDRALARYYEKKLEKELAIQQNVI